MKNKFTPKITLFYCINSFNESDSLPVNSDKNFNVHTVKMACSSMVKDVFLLRAFESGADAVIVFVCPEGQCRYAEGNIRAKKRVVWVKKILDEIGLDGKRLSIFNLSRGDEKNINKAIDTVLTDLTDLGPNPVS